MDIICVQYIYIYIHAVDGSEILNQLRLVIYLPLFTRC